MDYISSSENVDNISDNFAKKISPAAQKKKSKKTNITIFIFLRKSDFFKIKLINFFF